MSKIGFRDMSFMEEEHGRFLIGISLGNAEAMSFPNDITKHSKTAAWHEQRDCLIACQLYRNGPTRNFCTC